MGGFTVYNANTYNCTHTDTDKHILKHIHTNAGHIHTHTLHKDTHTHAAQRHTHTHTHTDRQINIHTHTHTHTKTTSKLINFYYHHFYVNTSFLR